jgi:F0F1-type ATP synthase assembly protein I
MNHPVLRFTSIVLAGVLLGALMGYFGQSSSGTCPLTSTWWRGALYGGGLGLLMALGARSS